MGSLPPYGATINVTFPANPLDLDRRMTRAKDLSAIRTVTVECDSQYALSTIFILHH